MPIFAPPEICENMEEILRLAARNTERAREIVDRLRLYERWQAAGAEVRAVGSLRMGLLMKHLDIDLHLYTERLDPAVGFAVMAELCADPAVREVQFVNGADTEERCLEWHCRYAREGEEWQIDMIQILRGSRYDGYFEAVADRIAAALTPETRTATLELKYRTPDGEKIPGIAVYKAVLQDGVRTPDELREWLSAHPITGILEF